MKRIVVPVPESAYPEHLALFNENSYTEPDIFNKEIKGAFVTFNGIVVRKGLFVDRDSIYSYPKNQAEFVRKGKEQAYHSLLLRKVPYSTINEPAFIVHQPWMNFYHWMLESLPRLIQLKDQWSNCSLVLPQRISELPFVKETLDLFPEIKVIIPKQENLWVKDLLLPNLRPQCHQYNKELLFKTRDEMLKRLGLQEIQPTRRLFIVRQKAAFRTIVNLDEACNFMASNGFEIIDLEDHSLAEQIRIIREAAEIMTQHGAALSHLLFAHAGTKVIELHKEVTNASDHLSRVYWYLAHALSLDYQILFCKPERPEDDFFKASVYFNPNKVANLLMKNG